MRLFKRALFILIILSNILRVSEILAQNVCNYSLNTGNDTLLCSPAPVNLHGTTNAPAANIRSVIWQPTAGLSSFTSLNPIANVNNSITYHLTVTAVSDSNLIVNGDFTAGPVGFTTAYIPGTGGTWGLLSNEGTYDINTNPFNDHSHFMSFGDHTTGTGNMLVVNGASVANVSVWCESINVVPYTNYSFSAWIASCVIDNPASLQFSINGNLVGPPFSAPAIAGTWSHFYQNWNSGSNTTASICIVNQNILVGGNDFAIDDISFNEVCTLTDSVMITIANAGSLHLGNDTAICSPIHSLTLSAASPVLTAHLWSTGDTSATIIVHSSGQYYVTNSVGGICTVRDTINVNFSPVAVDIDSASISLNDGDSVTLHSSVIDLVGGPPYSYSWTPTQFSSCDTCPSTIVTGDASSDNTYYYLSVTDNIGCRGLDSVLVRFIGCEAHVIIPNVFTPNGDNFNDQFYITTQCPDVFHFIIFNRWGKNMYESSDPNFHWNGKTAGGTDAAEGVYFYECTIGKQKLHGTLQLIRK